VQNKEISSQAFFSFIVGYNSLKIFRVLVQKGKIRYISAGLIANAQRNHETTAR